MSRVWGCYFLLYLVLGTSVLLKADDSRELWTFERGGAGSFTSPAIGRDGTVYVGSQVNNKVYALDGDTGTVKWELDLDGWVWDSLSVSPDGTLYFTAGNKIYAYDALSEPKNGSLT